MCKFETKSETTNRDLWRNVYRFKTFCTSDCCCMNWFVQMKYTYEYSNMVPGIPCIALAKPTHTFTPTQIHRVTQTGRHTLSTLTLALKLLKIFNSTGNREICNLPLFFPCRLPASFFYYYFNIAPASSHMLLLLLFHNRSDKHTHIKKTFTLRYIVLSETRRHTQKLT